MAAEYSKRKFLNTHDYSNLGYTAVASYIAENCIYPISVRVGALNISSGGRRWGVKKV